MPGWWRTNEIEGDGIYWWPDTGAIDLRDVVVHYAGMHCFEESNWDQGTSADEPYAILSMSTLHNVWAATSREYDDVDDGESCPDSMELYRGRPYGLNIGAVVMESDQGDKDVYRDTAMEANKQAHELGVDALKYFPAVGLAIVAVAVPALGGAISDAFNVQDDQVGSANITLSAVHAPPSSAVRSATARTDSFQGGHRVHLKKTARLTRLSSTCYRPSEFAAWFIVRGVRLSRRVPRTGAGGWLPVFGETVECR